MFMFFCRCEQGIALSGARTCSLSERSRSGCCTRASTAGRTPSAQRESTIFHHAKFLFVTRILVRAVLGVTRLHACLEFFDVADLSLVMEQGFHFDWPGIGHIEHDVC